MLFEKPVKEDGIRLFDLVAKCPPLDLNSKYAYHLVAQHFSGTSVIVRDPQNNNLPAGMISGYLLPQNPKILFIWQAALLPEYRGKGLAARMLCEILSRKELESVEYIHTTISPSNLASKHLFISFAQKRGANIETGIFLEEKDFDLTKKDKATPHEKEILYVIGPLSQNKTHSYKRSLS